MATSVLNDGTYLSSYGRTFYVNFNYPSYDPHVESRMGEERHSPGSVQMMCTLTINFLSGRKNPARPRRGGGRQVAAWQESDKTSAEQKHEKSVKLIPSCAMIKRDLVLTGTGTPALVCRLSAQIVHIHSSQNRSLKLPPLC